MSVRYKILKDEVTKLYYDFWREHSIFLECYSDLLARIDCRHGEMVDLSPFILRISSYIDCGFRNQELLMRTSNYPDSQSSPRL